MLVFAGFFIFFAQEVKAWCVCDSGTSDATTKSDCEDVGDCHWKDDESVTCLCPDQTGAFNSEIASTNGECPLDCKRSQSADANTINNAANNAAKTDDTANGSANKKDDPALQATFEGFKTAAKEKLNPANFDNLNKAFGRVIGFFAAGIGSFALALYIWAGFLWMTAMGNSDRIEKAKDTIVWTSLGAAVILSAYVIVSFVFTSIVPVAAPGATGGSPADSTPAATAPPSDGRGACMCNVDFSDGDVGSQVRCMIRYSAEECNATCEDYQGYMVGFNPGAQCTN